MSELYDTAIAAKAQLDSMLQSGISPEMSAKCEEDPYIFLEALTRVIIAPAVAEKYSFRNEEIRQEFAVELAAAAALPLDELMAVYADITARLKPRIQKEIEERAAYIIGKLKEKNKAAADDTQRIHEIYREAAREGRVL